MKNVIVIIAIVGVLILFTAGKANAEGSDTVNAHADTTDATLSKAFSAVADVYGNEIAANAERIFRWETGNFKAQFTFDTASPGMNAMSDKFPYGWTSLSKFWGKYPQYRPVGVSSEHDRGSGRPLVVFPTIEAGAMSLAEFLKQHNNNVGRWNSLNPAEQKIYSDNVMKITPGYVKA